MVRYPSNSAPGILPGCCLIVVLTARCVGDLKFA